MTASVVNLNVALVDPRRLVGETSGYGATVNGSLAELADITTDDYAETQQLVNARKALDFVLPHLRQCGAKAVLDIGCGVGKMVTTLSDEGFDTYGVDLSGLQRRWKQLNLPSRQFFVVGPDQLALPFHDASLDFVFSLGVIEHVGTKDGHANRRPDYHVARRQWVGEIFRTLKPGGHMLLAGPNRSFPIDVAHGLDDRANKIERWLSSKVGASVHKPWGEYFLWNYADFHQYLTGADYKLTPLSVASYVHYSRVPRYVRPLVKFYVDHLPSWLLDSGFNPWVAALVRKCK